MARLRPDEVLLGARPLSFPDDHALTVRGVRIPIPKDPAVNRSEYRRLIVAGGFRDPERAKALRWLCSERTADALLFWLNTFAWTYVQQKVTPDGSELPVTGRDAVVPFVTHYYQDELCRGIFASIESGHDLAVDKTRKMGLSWMILATFHWYWQFHANCNFMEVSRKEDLVDNPGDPDALFWKHDFLNSHQPSYMLPVIRRTALKLVNCSLNSTIIGQSTTGDVGHGGRKTAVLFDEMSRMKQAKHAWEGASQMTNTRIGNSTARGPGFFSEIVHSGKVKVLAAPFYDHPDFGRGRYIKRENGKQIISSPWRDRAVAKAVSRREVAENIDRDHMGAGYVFFDHDQLERHAAASVRTPDFIGHIRFTGKDDRSLNLSESRRRREFVFDPDAPDRPWSLWCDLVEDENGEWRPLQTRTYIFGMDIAFGLQAANSTIIVMDLETRQQVGEYASATVDPVEFAMQAMEASYWWGGARGCAFMAWEANGAGGLFGRSVTKHHHPWIFFQRAEEGVAPKTKRAIGWTSNEQRKADVLGVFRGALARDTFIPRSAALIREARGYIFHEDGSLGPASLEHESAAAEATHGDRVIGGALAVYCSQFANRCNPPERAAPKFSQAYRFREWKKAKGRTRDPFGGTI